MDFIDIFDFQQYFQNPSSGKRAKVGHVNAVISELNALQSNTLITPFVYYSGFPLDGTYRVTTTLVGGKYTYENWQDPTRTFKFNNVDNRWEYYENDIALYYASTGPRPAFSTWYDINTDEPFLIKYFADPADNIQESNELFAQNITQSKTITKVVNISSSEILAMGTTPIELLPAPGIGKYYKIESVVLEYTHGTTNYTINDDTPCVLITDSLGYANAVISQFFLGYENTYIVWNGDFKTQTSPAANGDHELQVRPLNSDLILTLPSGGLIADGDGTIRAIITYSVRTFGV